MWQEKSSGQMSRFAFANFFVFFLSLSLSLSLSLFAPPRWAACVHLAGGPLLRVLDIIFALLFIFFVLIFSYRKSFLTLLRDSVVVLQFSESDLEFQKQSLIFEYEDQQCKPDQFVPEHLLATAFKNCALGNTALPAPEIISRITLEQLLDFRDRNVRGPQVVIGGTGVDFGEMCKLGESLFGNLNNANAGVRHFPLIYSGGDCVLIEGEEEKKKNNINCVEEGSRIHIGFPAPSLLSSDYYAASGKIYFCCILIFFSLNFVI